jgi:hypothetical protein
MFERLKHRKMLEALLKMRLYLRVTFPDVQCKITDPGSYVFADKHSQWDYDDNDNSKAQIENQQENKSCNELEGSAKDIWKRDGKGRRYDSDILLHTVKHISRMMTGSPVTLKVKKNTEKSLAEPVLELYLRCGLKVRPGSIKKDSENSDTYHCQ